MPYQTGRVFFYKATTHTKKTTPDGVVLKSGAWGRNRTADTGIFSPLLYRLSYPGQDLILNIYTKMIQKSSLFLIFFNFF